MRKLVLPAIAAAAVAVAVLASGGGAHAAKVRVIRVVEHATTDTTVSTKPSGDNTGDLLTFHNQLFDATDHKAVGRDLGHCVRIVPADSYDCAWVAFLAGGQITVYGPFYDAKDSVLAITGGTGAYASARGSMRLHARNGGKEYEFTYNLG